MISAAPAYRCGYHFIRKKKRENMRENEKINARCAFCSLMICLAVSQPNGQRRRRAGIDCRPALGTSIRQVQTWNKKGIVRTLFLHEAMLSGFSIPMYLCKKKSSHNPERREQHSRKANSRKPSFSRNLDAAIFTQ